MKNDNFRLNLLTSIQRWEQKLLTEQLNKIEEAKVKAYIDAYKTILVTYDKSERNLLNKEERNE